MKLRGSDNRRGKMSLKEQDRGGHKAGPSTTGSQVSSTLTPQLLPPSGQEKERDPRVKRTRQLLVQAFMDLLSEKDFQSLTVQDITARATLNRATFYAHFEDKYALQDYAIREIFQQMLDSRISISYEINEDNLRQLVLMAFEFLEQFHDHCNRLHKRSEPLVEGQVQVLLYEFLLAWFKKLKPDEVGQLETSASTISWAIFGVGLEWSRGSKKKTAEETANQVLNLIIRGLPSLAGYAAAMSH